MAAPTVAEFQRQYAEGIGLESLHSVPAQPAVLGSNDSLTDADVDSARRLFQTIGFAAPKPATEADRLRALRRYGLYDAQHNDTIRRIYRLALRIVPKDSGVFLALIGENEQTVVAGAPEGALREGALLPRDGGFCGHTILSKRGIEVPDAAADWRFANSPFVKSGVIGAYHGLPLRLRVESGASDPDRKEVTIGAFCVYSGTARSKQTFIDEDTRQILLDLAGLVEHEFTRLTERRQQAREARLAESADEFLSVTLSRDSHCHDTLNSQLCDSICKNICQVLDCDICYILDMRGFLGQTEEAMFLKRRLIGFWSGTDPRDDVLATLQARPSMIWQQGLSALAGRRHAVYNGHSAFAESPFHSWTASSATAFLIHSFVAPVADSQIIIVASTAQPHVFFSKADIGYVTALGNMALNVSIRQRMQTAEREKTAFIQRISHEIRTPLHGLRSQIALLASDAISLPAFLRTANVCSSMLEDIIEDILLFDELDEQSSQTPEQTLQTPVHIKETTLCLVRLALARQVNIGGTADQSLAVRTFYDVQDLGNEAHWTLKMDASGYQRVVLALLLNAVKFTTSGSIVVSSGLEVKDDRHHYVLDVVDTGCGMSADFLRESAFKPFVQEDNFSQGIGLGLNIVQSVVRRMGGHIALNSVRKTGTAVRVTWPIASDHELPDTKSLQAAPVLREEVLPFIDFDAASLPSSTSVTSRGFSWSQTSNSSTETSCTASSSSDDDHHGNRIVGHPLPIMRILAVDDNAIARRILTTIITQTGADYQEAADGEEALAAFKSFRPHVVLTDIAMPRMDGFESSLLMRKYEQESNWTAAVIVAISAHPEPPLLQAPFDKWCVKGRGDVLSIRNTLCAVQEQLERNAKRSGRRDASRKPAVRMGEIREGALR